MARTFKIPRSAHDALTRTAVYRGSRVIITEQLGSDVWPGVRATLENLGAVYVIGASAFEFEPDRDARTVVDDALTAGHITAVWASHGYVPTPPAVAEEVVDRYGHLYREPGRVLRVLEPSAGSGPLVSAIMRGGERDPERCAYIAEWMHVTAVEIDERRARQIPSSAAVDVVRDDFLAWAVRTRKGGGTFDRVVMNPPFSVKGAAASVWTRHVTAAWELLAPGGRLVAVVPARGVSDVTHGNVGVRAVQDLMREYGGAELLDADAFAASGFTVDTAVLWLDRPPVSAPANPVPVSLPAWAARQYTGAETLVPVTRPFMSRAATVAAPVQALYDSHRRETRILRYQGTCYTCDRIVWAFDDGENSPAGQLGDAHAPACRDPEEYGMPPAPAVVQCFMCGQEGEQVKRVETHALAWWPTVTPAAPTTAPVGVSHVSDWTQELLPL